MTWYLRSMGDQDTHEGELGAKGTVAASCGVRFTPLPLPYDRVSLPGYPQDRDQICPTCETRRKQGVSRRPSTGRVEASKSRPAVG